MRSDHVHSPPAHHKTQEIAASIVWIFWIRTLHLQPFAQTADRR